MRLIVVAVLAGSITGSLAAPPAFAKPARAVLTIRTYDTFGVGAADAALARRTAEEILGAAGITVTWRECPAVRPALENETSPCHDALGSREVIVRLMAATRQTAPRKLGESIVDASRAEGALTTIYADRVASTAALAELEAGTLYGRTIAHEIGHLLLGTVGHASRGLMRASWSVDELRRDQKSDWLLSKDEAASIRQHLADPWRRERRSPTLVVASARTNSAAHPRPVDGTN